mmetsp:Transcript_28825/g.83444  ORF Transcript_28825/g.83444 Transcript_28825/m.83444 type:complete len:734 (+) Transcript_28825:505-2706(+)
MEARREDGHEIVGHNHRGDHRLARLEIRGQADGAPWLVAAREVPLVYHCEVADGRERVHPIRHLLSADLVEGGNEGGKGRVGHEARPPGLRRIRHVVAGDVRCVELLDVVCVGHPIGRGRVEEAVAGNAAVTDGAARILEDDPIQEPLGSKSNVLSGVAVPVVHHDFAGLLPVQDVVHRYAPSRAAGIRPERPEPRPGLRALAAVGADPRRVPPRHANTIQIVVVRARGLDADPIRDGAGRARRVVQDVVPGGHRGVECLGHLVQRRGLAGQGIRHVVVVLLLPMLQGEVAHRAVVGRGEVARTVAPRLLQRLELAVLGQQAAPHRAELRYINLLAIWEDAVEVREAEVSGSEGNNRAHDHVYEIAGEVKRMGCVDHAEDCVLVAVGRGPHVALDVLLRKRELPRRHARRRQLLVAPLDRRNAIGPLVHLGRGVRLVLAAGEGLSNLPVRRTAVDHALPTLDQGQAVVQCADILALRREEALDHDAVAHALCDDAARHAARRLDDDWLDALQTFGHQGLPRIRHTGIPQADLVVVPPNGQPTGEGILCDVPAKHIRACGGCASRRSAGGKRLRCGSLCPRDAGRGDYSGRRLVVVVVIVELRSLRRCGRRRRQPRPSILGRPSGGRSGRSSVLGSHCLHSAALVLGLSRRPRALALRRCLRLLWNCGRRLPQVRLRPRRTAAGLGRRPTGAAASARRRSLDESDHLLAVGGLLARAAAHRALQRKKGLFLQGR